MHQSHQGGWINRLLSLAPTFLTQWAWGEALNLHFTDEGDYVGGGVTLEKVATLEFRDSAGHEASPKSHSLLRLHSGK